MRKKNSKKWGDGMRLIDADELKEVAHEMIQEDPEAFNGGYSYNAVTVEEIDEAPTIEAVPVVHGEWIKIDGDWKNQTTGESVTVHQCSICGSYFLSAPYNFCPHCGADMRKKV